MTDHNDSVPSEGTADGPLSLDVGGRFSRWLTSKTGKYLGALVQLGLLATGDVLAGVLASAMGELRANAFASELEAKFGDGAGRVMPEREAQDIIGRAFRGAIDAPSEEIAARYGTATAELVTQEGVDYAEAVEVLEDMDSLSSADWDVLRRFAALGAGRGKVGEVAEAIDGGAGPRGEPSADTVSGVAASVGKLEGRGLLVTHGLTDASVRSVFIRTGPHWSREHVNSGYQVTHKGRRLLQVAGLA